MPTPGEHNNDKAVELLLRHRRIVWWLCLRHARGEFDYGHDLVQEVAAVLCRCVPHLHPGASTKEEQAWVHRITRTVLSNLSRRPTVPTVPLKAKHDHAEHDEKKEQRELLDELAAHLDDDRTMLQLHLDGFSNYEIGIILELKTDTVRQRMYRLVFKLREIYEILNRTTIQ